MRAHHDGRMDTDATSCAKVAQDAIAAASPWPLTTGMLTLCHSGHVY